MPPRDSGKSDSGRDFHKDLRNPEESGLAESLEAQVSSV